MTIVVTVKVHDGVVMAADSATSFFDSNGIAIKIYNNANKLYNLVKGWPIGAMVYGSGGIGSASISTLSKDLRRRLFNAAVPDVAYQLKGDEFTIEEVAQKARKFFYDECFKGAYGDQPPKGFFWDIVSLDIPRRPLYRRSGSFESLRIAAKAQIKYKNKTKTGRAGLVKWRRLTGSSSVLAAALPMF